MSDQNKFVNLYIDNALGMASDYLKQIVQLKTQLDISNDLVHQKDEVISSLQSDSEKIKTDSYELSKALDDVKRLEAECTSLRNKAAHLDAMTSQFNQMKNDFINKQNDLNNLRNQDASKDTEISKYKVEINQLKEQVSQKDQEIQSLSKKVESLSKKPINSKIKQKPIVPDKVIESGDDF